MTLAPFAESGDAAPRLLLSSVFRNDPAYRRFFRLWQDMNLGIAAMFGDFLGMPLARTFELYELWCFLRLVRAATEEYGHEGVDVGNLFVREAAARRDGGYRRCDGAGRGGLEAVLSEDVPGILAGNRRSRLIQPDHEARRGSRLGARAGIRTA